MNNPFEQTRDPEFGEYRDRRAKQSAIYKALLSAARVGLSCDIDSLSVGILAANSKEWDRLGLPQRLSDRIWTASRKPLRPGVRASKEECRQFAAAQGDRP